MIALVTTYFLVFYILIPGVLFRFLTSWFVPLKLFERTRTQEATFAVAVAILPFAFTLVGVWHLPVVRHDPFPVAEGTAAQLHQDYRRIAGLITSSDASKQLSLNPSAGAPTANDANWQALNRVLRRQARFLTWYFALIAAEGICFGLLARRYGDWRNESKGYRFRLWLIRTFILPNISEWHLLLTGFNWPKRDHIVVSVDILQNDGLLYQGRVADYFIDPEGKLTGILLEEVNRFDREAFHQTQASSSPASSSPASPSHASSSHSISRVEPPISSAAFWKPIPGSRFYIGQGSISNLNVRFVTRDQTLISLAEKILDSEDTDTYNVELASEDDSPNSHHPDIYS
jgi:hypothetical protein